MIFQTSLEQTSHLGVAQTLDAQSPVILTDRLREIFPEGEMRENRGKTRVGENENSLVDAEMSRSGAFSAAKRARDQSGRAE